MILHFPQHQYAMMCVKSIKHDVYINLSVLSLSLKIHNFHRRKTTTLSAIQSRVFFVENLLFKYLVVMTCNYATSGPSREREREAINIEWNGRWSRMWMESIVLCRLFQAWLNKQILKHFKHENQHCPQRTQTEQLRFRVLANQIVCLPADCYTIPASDQSWVQNVHVRCRYNWQAGRQTGREGKGRNWDKDNLSSLSLSWIVEPTPTEFALQHIR